MNAIYEFGTFKARNGRRTGPVRRRLGFSVGSCEHCDEPYHVHIYPL
jgi:hypothetical protein